MVESTKRRKVFDGIIFNNYTKCGCLDTVRMTNEKRLKTNHNSRLRNSDVVVILFRLIPKINAAKI